MKVCWLVDHVWRNDGDDGVEEPVGRGGDGKTLGTSLEREDLTRDDPGARTPCSGEESAVVALVNSRAQNGA